MKDGVYLPENTDELKTKNIFQNLRSTRYGVQPILPDRVFRVHFIGRYFRSSSDFRFGKMYEME